MATREVLWTHPFVNHQWVTTPTFAHGRIAVAAGGTLHVFAAEAQSVRHRHDWGVVRAYSAADGTELWSTQVAEPRQPQRGHRHRRGLRKPVRAVL